MPAFNEDVFLFPFQTVGREDVCVFMTLLPKKGLASFNLKLGQQTQTCVCQHSCSISKPRPERGKDQGALECHPVLGLTPYELGKWPWTESSTVPHLQADFAGFGAAQ